MIELPNKVNVFGVRFLVCNFMQVFCTEKLTLLLALTIDIIRLALFMIPCSFGLFSRFFKKVLELKQFYSLPILFGVTVCGIVKEETAFLIFLAYFQRSDDKIFESYYSSLNESVFDPLRDLITFTWF